MTRRFASAAFAVALISVAALRVHVRVQTTLIGYEIGRLKADEASLLEERSVLKMQLAKLTTKKHLELMTDGRDDLPQSPKGTLALQ
jgi:hypothetical protein